MDFERQPYLPNFSKFSYTNTIKFRIFSTIATLQQNIIFFSKLGIFPSPGAFCTAMHCYATSRKGVGLSATLSLNYDIARTLLAATTLVSCRLLNKNSGVKSRKMAYFEFLGSIALTGNKMLQFFNAKHSLISRR